MTDPNFLIVGAQKSGTTSLARWLRCHPDLAMPEMKELHYFSHPVRHQGGLEGYRRYFAGLPEVAALGEATPEYLYRTEVPRRIVDVLGPVRCIAVLRNPVDRAYSSWLHGLRLGQVPPTFEEALDDEDRRLALEQWGWGALADRGYYARQLRRYEKHMGRDRIHVELFDDLRSEPEAVLARVFTFLGLDPSPQPRSFKAYNVASRSVLPGVMQRRIQRIKDRRVRQWLRKRTMRPYTPPPMHPDTRTRLLEQFREPNRQLAEWLGRDLSAWDR